MAKAGTRIWVGPLLAKGKPGRAKVGRSWARPLTKDEKAKRSLAAKKGAETRRLRKDKLEAAAVELQEALTRGKRDRHAAAYGMGERRRAALGSSPLEGQLGQMDPSSPQTLLGQTLIDPARLAQLERDSRELEGRREEERVERAERMAKTRETSPHEAHHEYDIITGCAECTPKLAKLRGRVERETLAGEEVAARDRRRALEQVERAKGAAKGRIPGENWAPRPSELWGAGLIDHVETERELNGRELPPKMAGLKMASALFPPGWELRKDGFGWKGGAQGGEMPPPTPSLHGVKRSNMFDETEASPSPTTASALHLQNQALEELRKKLASLELRLASSLRLGWEEEDQARPQRTSLLEELPRNASDLVRALTDRAEQLRWITERVYRLYEALQL